MSDLIRVLIADDHAVVRAGTRQFLETASDLVVIAEADDGLMAQQLVAEQLPDVAVLDIRMPYANGIEITRWIRVHHPNVRVLILTAYDDAPYVKAVMEAGANGYMLKTAAPLVIIQAVRDIYAGHSFVGPAIAEKLLADEGDSAENPLTDRELQVLTAAGTGQTNKGIALDLGISSRTVQGHLANIYAKLGVGSRTEAVMKAVGVGWISAE